MVKTWLLLFTVLVTCDGFYQNHGYKLKKVVAMSRHNLRTPVSKDLDKITAKTWPHYREGPGQLTEKGAVLEGYMGSFLSDWLRSQGLLSKDCPSADEVYVYTNVMQRTKATGQAFVDQAFPGCDVPIYFSNRTIDRVFEPIIHNNSEEFKKVALEQMYDKMNSVNLIPSYNELNNILNCGDSFNCKYLNQCDLAKDSNTIIIDKRARSAIMGPLSYSTIAIDAFIMAYFNGFPMSDVAWGLMDEEKWQKLELIIISYHDVLFNTSLVAPNMARPLIEYIRENILSDNPKFTLIVGHDSNIYVLLRAMRFKPFYLHNQLEATPIGGKIIFQKWFDVINRQDLLKINYVYQSNEQIRKNITLSVDNPPEIVEMELEGCHLNKNGYCLWDDFVTLLENLYIQDF